MKLKRKLEELNQNEIVCIGSRSAFFFIGYPKEFIEREQDITDRWKKSAEKIYESAVIAYENCLNNPPSSETEVKRRERSEELNRMVDIVVPYETLLKEWQAKTKQLEESMNNAKRKLDKFTPFMERDIKESYRRIDNDGTVIIIRGYEVAPFWFRKEYEAAKRKGLA